jgi:hypothetical protein
MIAVAVGMLVLASRIEPHWCAKDVSAFTCRVRELSGRGDALTRWQDARAVVDGDRIVITRKVLLRPSTPEPPRTVEVRATAAPSGRAVFLLGGTPRLAVRVPAKSPAVARLEQLATGQLS